VPFIWKWRSRSIARVLFSLSGAALAWLTATWFSLPAWDEVGDSQRLGGSVASTKSTPPPGPQTVPADLQDGDLVFRSGRDIVSRMVLSQSQSPQYSHVGIVLRKDDQLHVIHAIPAEDHLINGTVLEPLASFISVDHASAYQYFRVASIQRSQRSTMRAFALSQQGKPFDLNFRLSDDSELYCTELVLRALHAAHFSFPVPGSPLSFPMLTEPVVPPDQLLASPLLQAMSLRISQP
jgi:hypothetical protein